MNNNAANLAGSGSGTTSSHLSKGKMATAAFIIIPFLVVLLALGAYLKTSRAKGKEKRKAFSENVDKRMSNRSSAHVYLPQPTRRRRVNAVPPLRGNNPTAPGYSTPSANPAYPSQRATDNPAQRPSQTRCASRTQTPRPSHARCSRSVMRALQGVPGRSTRRTTHMRGRIPRRAKLLGRRCLVWWRLDGLCMGMGTGIELL